MTEITQPTIERALTAVRAERKALTSERDAFRTLLGRVSGVQVDPPGTATARMGATVAVAGQQGPSPGLSALRTAYRETVMAVPHYEAEYGESLRENLAVECGPSLAGRLVDGDSLTQPVYDAFLEACRRSRDERDRALRHVERERRSLAHFADELGAIESAVIEAGERISTASRSPALSRIDGRLVTLQSRCEDLAGERQEELHGRAASGLDRFDGLDLAEYLYADLDTSTPVLTDVAACLDTIRNHRSRCLR